jgi:hypothetical protein
MGDTATRESALLKDSPQSVRVKRPVAPEAPGAAAGRTLGNAAIASLLGASAPLRLQRKCKACSAGGKPCAACAGKRSDPGGVRRQLGAGTALDGVVRSRMESVFRHDFSDVRVHTGSAAAQWSDRLDAHAFAVGRDVAFGPGQYRPGTIVGDALIAHELAHVVQQRGAAPAARKFSRNDSAHESLEHDADRSAAHAVKALWGRAAGLAVNAMPRLRSGLTLSRCGKGKEVAGNRLGNWNIDQRDEDASRPGGDYASPVDIYFNPNKNTVNCSEISFLQAIRIKLGQVATTGVLGGNYRRRLTPTGWALDRVEDREHGHGQYGWYGYNNNGRAGETVEPGSSPDNSAHMYDRPRWNAPNAVWEFETCAVCKTGHDVNSLYGCLTWGFDVDADNKLTQHVPAHHDAASAEFTAALGNWNAQAAGPAARRNDPGQVPLPAVH